MEQCILMTVLKAGGYPSTLSSNMNHGSPAGGLGEIVPLCTAVQSRFARRILASTYHYAKTLWNPWTIRLGRVCRACKRKRVTIELLGYAILLITSPARSPCRCFPYPVVAGVVPTVFIYPPGREDVRYLAERFVCCIPDNRTSCRALVIRATFPSFCSLTEVCYLRSLNRLLPFRSNPRS